MLLLHLKEVDRVIATAQICRCIHIHIYAYLDKGPSWVFAFFPVSQYPKDERLNVWDPDGALLSDYQRWFGLQVHASGGICWRSQEGHVGK